MTTGRSGFTQDNRALTLETPWGKNACLPNTFAVSERVSQPYTITLDGFCKPDAAAAAILGQPISLTVAWEGGSKKRYFHGIVNEVSFGGEVDRYRQVRLQAVPKFWLLTLTQKFRCFQDKSVTDIVKMILNEHGIETKWKVSGANSPWNFCFQYQESDFNFISRLLEHEGIFYYFEQSAGSHTMVLCDQLDAFTTCPGQSSANYAAEVGLGGGSHGYAVSWEVVHEVRSGSCVVRDWDFTKAQTLADNADTQNKTANKSHKLTEYPARVARTADGGPASDKRSVVRARIEEVEATNPIYQGATFVRSLFAGGQFELSGGPHPGTYNILAVNHTGSQDPPYLFGMSSGVIYSNSVTCIPKGVQYRPPRTARRSLVHGPQTALVIDGPDNYGRMKVKFFWGDDAPSAWLRVAQFWAGPQWGAVFLPQVDHEVLVDFIDGDPDNAIIVGSVYNGKNMPPYPLPSKYCYSTIKSKNNNEIRFDDTDGAEEIYVHAQKDMNRVVEDADTVKVIKGNRTITLDMGTEKIQIKMGDHIRKIDLGKSETEAMQSITLKVGANSIKIDQSGITLDGIMIKIKGQAMVDSQAPMQKMSGDAMVMIKGGITMIN